MSTSWQTPEALVTAVRHGLQPSSGPPVEIGADIGRQMVDLARFDHLTGFLSQAISDGALFFAEAHHQEMMTEAWYGELRGAVLIEQMAIQVAEILDGNSVRWAITKGPAFARLDYPDPTVRTFGDLDVLIHPDDWFDALRMLSNAGFDRATNPYPASYDRRFGKGATLTAKSGLELDAHLRFAVGRFGVRSRVEELFDSIQNFTVAGTQLPTLNRAGRMLHACFHAALGGFRRLRAYRDVAQIATQPGQHLEDCIRIAHRWRSEAVVAYAILGAWRKLRLDPEHEAYRAASSVKVSRADRLTLHVFEREKSFRFQVLTSLTALPPRQTIELALMLSSTHFSQFQDRLPMFSRRTREGSL